MKKRYVILSLILAGFLFLYGCGGGAGGAPGSNRSSITGIVISSVSITSDSPDLDAAIHLCPPDFTVAEEGLFREDATITIGATLVNPGFDTFPASVEECNITYKKANQDPASPIIENLTIYPNCILQDGDANECPVTLMDIQRKNDYWTDTSSGLNLPAEYPTHYIAVYECTYYNKFREYGEFQVEYDIWLADFDLC